MLLFVFDTYEQYHPEERATHNESGAPTVCLVHLPTLRHDLPVRCRGGGRPRSRRCWTVVAVPPPTSPAILHCCHRTEWALLLTPREDEAPHASDPVVDKIFDWIHTEI